MKKKKILVVEDEAPIRSAIASALGRIYDVVEASDGLEALKLLDEKIDLVFLDLNLPRLGGEGVSLINDVARIRAPIVVVTARDNFDFSDLGAGYIHRVIKKPFKLRDILAAAAEILEEAPEM